MKALAKRVKEAIHRRSFFGKVEEIADRRRQAFNKRAAEAHGRVASHEGVMKELRSAEKPDFQRIDDQEQLLFIAEQRLKAMTRKREFWRKRYVWARERHAHWGLVLTHRKDRLRRWIQQHETFQPYMANGKPWEELTPEARYGIFLDFKDGNYVTATYEGFPGDGVHSTTSYHYLQNSPDGKARCWDAGAGSLGPMEKAQRREAERVGAFLMEMFGPINDCEYKNGVRFTLAEGDPLETMHDNHKHTAIRDGAPTS